MNELKNNDTYHQHIDKSITEELNKTYLDTETDINQKLQEFKAYEETPVKRRYRFNHDDDDNNTLKQQDEK
jgi:hypothetical protein